MRRRDFITLAAAAAGSSLAARAQQPFPVIGFLRSTAAVGSEHLVKAFRQGLSEAGFVEGQNIAIEYRWADDQFDRLPGLAADLVRHQVAAIVGNAAVARVAKAATTSDPDCLRGWPRSRQNRLGWSLNRPGGNVTGVVFDTVELTAKRLGLLNELLPKVAVVGVLLDPSLLDFKSELKDVEEAGRSAGRQMLS